MLLATVFALWGAGTALLLGSVPGLWVAVPQVAPDARLWWSLLVTLALAILAGTTALWLARVSRRAARESAVLGRELEALRAGARTTTAGEDADGTRRRAQLAALLEINKRIAAAESSEALLSGIAEEAARLLDVEDAGIRLVEGDELVVAGAAGTGRETMVRARIRVGESFTGRVVAEGRTMVADLATVPGMIPEHREAGLRLGYVQCLGVPLRAGDRIIGVLAFRSRRPFSTGDGELAEAFAGQAALALQHARLYRTASRQADRMAALADVERLLAETLEPDVVAQRIADSVRMLLDAAAAGVYRVEPESGELVVIGLSTVGGRGGAWNMRLPDGHGMVGLAIRERRAVVTRDVLADPGVTLTPSARDTVERSGHRAGLGLPLVVRDSVIGGLWIADREAHVFDAEDVGLAQAFAHQAAVALENARLFGEAARQARRMGGLADVERLLSATLDPDVVARRIVDSVGTLLGARSAALYGLYPDTHEVTVVVTSRDEVAFEWPPTVAPEYGLIGIALAARRPASTSDVLADARLHFSDPVRASLAADGYRARLVVPLLVRDRVLGALAVADETGRVFGEQEIRLAQAFADQAAGALENARLFSLELARRAQMEALATVERELTAELDLERLLHLIVDRAGALFAGHGVIYLAADGALTPAASTVEAFAEARVPFGRGQAGTCAAERRGLLTNDYPHEPYALEDYVRLDTRRAMSHPLLLRDRLVGVITMSRRGHDAPAFSRDEFAVLESFATQAAIAIENARLHAEAERRRGEAEELARVARTLTESLEVASVGERIVDSVLSLVPARSAGLRLLAPDGSLVAVAWRGPEGGLFEIGHVQPAGTGLAALAIAQGRALWSVDVLDDPRFSLNAELRERALRYGHRAVVVAPLHAKSRTIGALIVADASPRQFSTTEVALVRAIADQAALALDNARLHEEAEQRRREAEFMTELARTINASLDLGLVLHRIAEGARELCESDVARIALREPPSERFRFRHWAGARCDTHDRVELVPGRGLAGQVIATGRPFRTDDYAGDPGIADDDLELARAEGIVAELSVPIRIAGRVEGLLSVSQRTARRFTDRDEAILTQLADHAAIAVQNARLYTEAQQRLRETTTLLAVGQALSQPGSAEDVMRRVARETARAMGADMAGAYVVDDGGEALRALAGYRVPESLREVFRRQRIVLPRFPFVRDAARAGRPVWSSDPHADDRFDREWVSALPPHSVLFAPTRLRGESVGGLFLVWWRTGHAFEDAEIRLIEGIAAQVGLALENAELARQREVRLKETQTLLAVSRSLSSTLDVDALLRQFMRQIARALGADTVGVWLLDDDGESLVPVAGYRVPRGADARAVRLSIVRHPFYAEAARTRRPVFSVDAPSDARMAPEVMERFPHRSQLFAPILAKDRLVGGFVAIWWKQPRIFTAGELALIEAISSQAGVAIENARLFQQNRRQVEELSVLNALSRAVTGQLDLAALLDTLRATVLRALDARRMVVLLLDDKTDEFEVALRVDADGAHPVLPRRSPRLAGLAALVAETGRTLRTDDYVAECRRRGRELPPVHGLRYWIGAPMLAGDIMLGVVTASRDDGPYTADDERLLGSIADVAALALRSARLFEERTRAYAELAAAQDHLVRTEKLRALGEMASGVAHDFNNLLAAILGRTQLLLREVADERLRRWLEVVEQSALDGAQTVRRLQDFARVRRDEPKVPVDLNQVVRDAVELTQSRWHEDAIGGGVSVEVRTALDEVPRVAGDPAELREAMTNLILNAIDAMPAGGTLTLTTGVGDGHVTVRISDTGVGIPADVRDRIFDPFFTTKGIRGTGLGLSMTYAIIARHGGAITVESEPERGSTFTLTLPSSVGAPASAPAPEPPATASVGLRCLVVDDEEVVGEVIGDVLQSLGHGVVVLTDGAEAIARLGAEPFDLVVTDLAMPGVSGWEVAAAVKARTPRVPVFIVTGFAVVLSPEERRAHGVEAIFSKPLKIDEMADAIRRVASRRAAKPSEER